MTIVPISGLPSLGTAVRYTGVRSQERKGNNPTDIADTVVLKTERAKTFMMSHNAVCLLAALGSVAPHIQEKFYIRESALQRVV